MTLKPKGMFKKIFYIGLLACSVMVLGYIFELINRTDKFSHPTSIGSDVIGAVYFFSCAGFVISLALANRVKSIWFYGLFCIIYLGDFISFFLLHFFGYVKDFSS